jgi:hypothetical protein
MHGLSFVATMRGEGTPLSLQYEDANDPALPR